MKNTTPKAQKRTWSPFVDWLHLVLTVIASVLLLPLAFGDVLSGFLLAAVGYLVASAARPLVKKYAVHKTVVFDIHGVYIAGDFNIEALYEIEGTRDLIQRLRKKYKVAALTNMGPELFNMWSRKWDFAHTYDYVYYSGQYRIKKPDPKLFEIVLKDLNAKPEDTVFLDDTAENVEAAKKLGIQGIVFKNAKQAEEELKKLGFGP
ncbi:HAD family phosphatase [Candidatus Micrarchaeota archaeon]|nr:HAD family phosphatase [Candidatus Micrarchaeota archaeon]